MRPFRLIAFSLGLTAVAYASNSTLPKSVSSDVRQAVEKADSALNGGDRQLALALYKGSLYTADIKIAIDRLTLNSDDQIRAVTYAINTWELELNGDLPVVLVNETDDADVVLRFVDTIPDKGSDALGLIQLEKRYRWSKTSHRYECNGSISIVRSASGGPLSYAETRDVVMHEIGHLIGLGDVESTGMLMGPMERGKPHSRPTQSEVEDVKSLRQTLRDKIMYAESLPQKRGQ